MDQDLTWTPKNTWIVIGVAAGALIFVITGTAIYETVVKPRPNKLHSQTISNEL